MNVSPLKVLLIVDDWESLDIYEAELAPHFEIFTAPFYEEGLRLAAVHTFDHIVIDLTLEDLNGAEMVALLKQKNGATPPYTVIASPDDKPHSQDIPPIHILLRPFTYDALRKRIR